MYLGKISAIYSQARQYWLDLLLVVVLGFVAGLASYQGAQLLNPYILTEPAEDVWFGSDISRVWANMVYRWSDHHRTKVHPLFTLIAFPSVYLLSKAGIEPITAVRMVIAFVASLWLGTLFVVLRLISCRRFDATLFSLLTATSAAAVFWFVIPEIFSFSSLSLLLALCFTVIAQDRKLSSLWYMAVSAVTLSVTTTNWMAGMAIAIANHPWKRALQITVNALCVVVLLWSVQKVIFPSAQFFIGDYRDEVNYVLSPQSGGPLQVIKSFVCDTMVMPTINIGKYTPHDWLVMSIQSSRPGSASLWGTVAVVLWTALLGLGLWGFFSIKQHLKFRIVLGLTLLGQLALHFVYGEETFLYSLHFVILLVVLVAFSTLTPARPLALLLTGMLVLSAGINNGLQLNKAIEFVESVAPVGLQPADPKKFKVKPFLYSNLAPLIGEMGKMPIFARN